MQLFQEIKIPETTTVNETNLPEMPAHPLIQLGETADKAVSKIQFETIVEPSDNNNSRETANPMDSEKVSTTGNVTPNANVVEINSESHSGDVLLGDDAGGISLNASDTTTFDSFSSTIISNDTLTQHLSDQPCLTESVRIPTAASAHTFASAVSGKSAVSQDQISNTLLPSSVQDSDESETSVSLSTAKSTLSLTGTQRVNNLECTTEAQQIQVQQSSSVFTAELSETQISSTMPVQELSQTFESNVVQSCAAVSESSVPVLSENSCTTSNCSNEVGPFKSLKYF